MASPYKRRRPSLVRNFWVYRRVVLLAMVLGLMLWFIWSNNASVEVNFPFRLGVWKSTTGLVILLSALFGSVVTALGMAVLIALRQLRTTDSRPSDEALNPLPDDRPPANYAAKASSEAPPDQHW